jgi:hypothetical protein
LWRSWTPLFLGDEEHGDVRYPIGEHTSEVCAMDKKIQKSDQAHVFPKITAPELREYLRQVFPTAKFRVQPRGSFVTGATIDVSWTGLTPDQVREAVETLEPGSCLFTATHFMSGAPGPILPGAVFFFADRKVFHQHQQQRGNVG